jgi:hypothetical protein
MPLFPGSSVSPRDIGLWEESLTVPPMLLIVRKVEVLNPLCNSAVRELPCSLYMKSRVVKMRPIFGFLFSFLAAI